MAIAETKRRFPVVVLITILAVAVAVIFGIRSFTEEKLEVRVSPVSRENLISSVSTNGKVEPVEPFQAHAPFSGVVQKVLVQIGQKVKKGDPLLLLNDADARARLTAVTAGELSVQNLVNDMKQGGTKEERIVNTSELERTRTQRDQMEKTLSTLRDLQAKGAASNAEVLAAEQRLQAADRALATFQSRTENHYTPADIKRAEAQYMDARTTTAAARANLSTVDIRAPFAGTVYSLPVAAYDFVPGGEDLLDLADLNHLQVRAYFDEPEIGKLARGQAVKIDWPAKPNQVWHGHIERAPTTVIAYGTRNVGECIITVDDVHGGLLPNVNVTVTVTTSQRFNVVSIPREALHTDGAANYVFRVVNRRLVRTDVGVGAINLTRVEITRGLTEKDTVATTPTTSNRDLTNGLEVTTVE